MIDNYAHTCIPLLIIFLFLFHARLCVYRLAHTCTPLQINILILILIHTFIHAQLCVYGLAHTPLLIIFIIFIFMCGFVSTNLCALALLF
jgi:hypothetical protein